MIQLTTYAVPRNRKTIKRILFSFLSGILFSIAGFGQGSTLDTLSQEFQPPIPVELFIGHRALSYQHVFNKNLWKQRINFFNISAIDAEFGENPGNQFVISSFVSYNVGKGFSVGLGGEIQPPGAVMYVGAQYAYASQRFLLVIFPSVNLNGPTQFAQFSLLEYRPSFNEKLSGYFRIQFLVSTDFHVYGRGYQQFRAGLQVRNIQFGLAANFDQFNSNAIKTSNYGLFGRVLIF